jgi:glycosyltransferase involved in cell wall biosynthesis
VKPKIIHVLDDHSVGGIVATTQGLSNSRLRQQFEFRLVRSRDVLSLLQSKQADLIIFRNPSAWHRTLNLAAIRLYTKRLILHEHHYSASFERFQVPSVNRFRTMLRMSYRFADRVIAISQAQANWMQQYDLVAPQKLTLIRQCPKLETFLAVPNKVIQQPLIVGAYGRFCQQKGFDVLLKAMRSLPSQTVQLYLAGYGEDEALLRELAQGQSNVKFLGTAKDVPAFLQTCDVIAIPSRWEPWGNVCVEARAAGKPIIASDVDGLSEQVKSYGVLVPPDEPEKLAEAIVTFSALSAEILSAWGQQARDSVSDAWDIYLNQWETLLWQELNI